MTPLLAPAPCPVKKASRSIAAAIRTLALLLVCISPARAILVQFDYSYDAANGNFFGQNPAAKATLDTAAADLSHLITTSLGAVPTDVFTGSGDGATIKFDWSLSFPNPATGATVTLQNFSLAPDIVVFRVGMRPLSAALISAGASVTASLLPSIVTSSSQGYATATAAAQAASDAVMARGSGPIMGSVTGSFATASYTAKYGAFGGSIWFDNDRDNNGLPDSTASLLDYWHVDAGSPVPADKYDLYTAAMREMIKGLGFGASQSWKSLAQGTSWIGPNVDRAFGGSSADLVTTDGYVTPGLTGIRLLDGTTQEALMSPTLAIGIRKTPTTLDAAFLQDFGYQAIPEPGSAGLLVGGLALLARSRRLHRYRAEDSRG